MSLRYRAARECVACKAESRRRRVALEGSRYLGQLCVYGHAYGDTGRSLRYRSSGGCVACASESARRWHAGNPEAAAAKALAYHSSEKGRETRLAWYARTRAARRAYTRLANRRKRARRHGVVRVPYTLDDIVALFATYGGCCAYCGAQAGEADHVVPLRQGGRDALYNLAPACRSCNARKFSSRLEEWYPRQPFFGLERLRFMAEQQIAAGLPRLTLTA